MGVRKKYAMQKVPRAKGPGKRKDKRQEKKFATGSQKKLRLMYIHQIEILHIFAANIRENYLFGTK